MAPPQKSTKQATKGVKQIVDENVQTLTFYRNMALIASAITLVIVVFYNSAANIVLYLFACAVYMASYQFMSYMSRARFTDSGQVADSGVDLNMEGGVAEHVKDVIILTAGCQLLSAVISNYFWYLWLLAPGRAFWMLWKSVLSPYFFPTDVPEPEVNEKKQKKMERRMKRQQQ